MTHKQHGPAFLSHITHFPQTFLLKFGITYGEDLIDDEYLRLQMGGDGEGEADIHAAGVAFYRGIEVSFHLGKSDDFIEFLLDFRPGHPQDRSVEIDILPPGKLRVETRAHLQEAGDAALDCDPSRGGFGDAAEDLEEGALAGAVPADDPHGLAALDLEAHVLERPDLFQGVASDHWSPTD